MSSDRARDSYDPTRQYRAVVAQQGRVTLDADVNEAQEIAAENVRAETLDIVGPCGTPDDGYAVGGSALPDFEVGAGTMYVGGLRVALPHAITYEKQAETEWLDHDGDPLWVDPKSIDGKTSEFVYLLLREQEVGAVEDVPLREVALGGPDTAQRTRLIQRIVRLPVKADQCAPALKIAEQAWSDLGVEFDPNSMALASPARLQVKFVQQPVAASPCDPQVQGGYLGADNQLIRVQITGLDDKTKTGRFVWGYNNASFLSRIKVVDAQTVELAAAPIDSYHTPGVNRAIEILRSAVDLLADNYIAAHSGVVTTPSQAFVPETRRLALPNPLPGAYVGNKPPSFLRLWEAEVNFTSGQPADLAGTGLQVVIDLQGSFGALTVGQFWTFSVRPSTPVNVYPQRYLDAGQPSEGPRMWACPLATIGWPEKKFSLLADCREKFDNLVELTKRHTQCCSVVITPADVDGGAGLGKLLDTLKGSQATVSLQPGQYDLIEPLRLSKEHEGLTLEGCHDGAVLAAKAGFEDKFADGLVLLNAVNDFTLRHLRFQLPLAKMRALGENDRLSIGVRVIHCAELHIEECLFRFVLAPTLGVKAMAIWATDDCWNMRVERNRFLHDDQYVRDKTPQRLLIGFAATETFSSQTGRPRKSEFLPVMLENASITGNEFSGLTMAVFVRAEFGRLRCENNHAHGCDGGFYFANTSQQLLRESLLDAFRNRGRAAANETVFADLLHAAQASVLSAVHDFAIRSPLPAGPSVRNTVTIGRAPDATTTRKIRADAKRANAQLLAGLGAVVAAAPAPTTSAKRRPQPARAAPAASAAQPGPAVDISAEQIRQMTGSFLVKFPTDAAVVRHVPALRFTGNDVEILPSAARAQNNIETPMVCLWVVLDSQLAGSVMVTANDLRGSSPQKIAIVSHPRVAVVAGNLILNFRNDATSVFIQVDNKSGLMNVSGNALLGGYTIIPAPPAAGSGAPPPGTGTDWIVLNSRK